MNRLANANDRCAGVNQLVRHSAFLQFMAWWEICSDWVGTDTSDSLSLVSHEGIM